MLIGAITFYFQDSPVFSAIHEVPVWKMLLVMPVGFTRLMYPFFAGLLASRFVRPGKINGAFLWSSVLLLTVMSIPHLGGPDGKWINGLYDVMAVILVFPLIVYIGASGRLNSRFSTRVSRFLGDISYPIYIIHYPLIYMFMAWVTRNAPYIREGTTGAILSVILAALAVLAGSIALAYACVKWYDLPVRKWLMERFMGRKSVVV